MEPKTVTIKEARDNFSEIIERAAIAGETFVITKFGKSKALITPTKERPDKKSEAAMLKSRRAALEATFGAWKHRTDIKDPAQWARELRRKSSSRYGKIFD